MINFFRPNEEIDYMALWESVEDLLEEINPQHDNSLYSQLRRLYDERIHKSNPNDNSYYDHVPTNGIEL